MLLKISTSRKRSNPTADSTTSEDHESPAPKSSVDTPPPPAPDTPPPTQPTGVAEADKAVVQPTVDLAVGPDGRELIGALSSVGIPAGLFTDGVVVPEHAAAILRDHAVAIGVEPTTVNDTVINALKLLHIIDDATASRILSALDVLDQPATSSVDSPESTPVGDQVP